ncbi:hypothetical protein GCM10027093_60300 [Paraburkholderia jirisanensis]
MDDLRELALLGSLDKLNAAGKGHYGDALITLGNRLLNRPPRKYIDALVGILPAKLPRKPPEWIRIYVITSTGSDYAAVRGVEEALARYYEDTGILAVVDPMRRRKELSLKEQFPYAVRTISERGAVIYANK